MQKLSDANLLLPVIAAPMFIASGIDLVKAQCQAGFVGALPSLNARPQACLADWLAEISEENSSFAAAHPDKPLGPLAVNLIVHRSNNRLEHDLEQVVKHQVPVVITSLGAREDVFAAVHAYGGTVLHDVISNRFALKAIEKGADGLVAVAAGAGGHAGVQNPFALLREIREWFSGPLALSGAISHGASILAALTAGADYAYIGSAFLATKEANISPEYRDMVLASSAADIVYTSYFTGVHGNYLRGSIERQGIDPQLLKQGDAQALSFATAADGSHVKPKTWKEVWGAGQGIGHLVKQLTVAELAANLAAEYAAAKQRVLDF